MIACCQRGLREQDRTECARRQENDLPVAQMRRDIGRQRLLRDRGSGIKIASAANTASDNDAVGCATDISRVPR